MEEKTIKKLDGLVARLVHSQDIKASGYSPFPHGSALYGLLSNVDEPTSIYFDITKIKLEAMPYDRRIIHGHEPIGIYQSHYKENVTNFNSSAILTLMMNDRNAYEGMPIITYDVPSGLDFSWRDPIGAYARHTPIDNDFNIIKNADEPDKDLKVAKLPFEFFTQNSYIDAPLDGSVTLTITREILNNETPPKVIGTEHYEYEITSLMFKMTAYPTQYNRFQFLSREYRNRQEGNTYFRHKFAWTESTKTRQTALPATVEYSDLTRRVTQNDGEFLSFFTGTISATFEKLKTDGCTEEEFFQHVGIYHDTETKYDGYIEVASKFDISIFQPNSMAEFKVVTYDDGKMDSANIQGHGNAPQLCYSDIHVTSNGDMIPYHGIIVSVAGSGQVFTWDTLNRKVEYWESPEFTLSGTPIAFANWCASKFNKYPFNSNSVMTGSQYLSSRCLEAVDVIGATDEIKYHLEEIESYTMYGNISTNGAYGLLSLDDYVALVLIDGSGYYDFNLFELLELDDMDNYITIKGVLFDGENMVAWIDCDISNYSANEYTRKVLTLEFEPPLPKPTQLVYDFRLAQYGFIPCQTRYMGKGGIISKV